MSTVLSRGIPLPVLAHRVCTIYIALYFQGDRPFSFSYVTAGGEETPPATPTILLGYIATAANPLRPIIRLHVATCRLTCFLPKPTLCTSADPVKCESAPSGVTDGQTEVISLP